VSMIQNPVNTKLTRYLALLIYMSLLCFMSLVSLHAPGEKVSTARQVFDNFLHVPAYAVLTFLLVRCFGRTTATPGVGAGMTADMVAAATIALGYGILMEFLQGLTPSRTPSLMDVGLNAVGSSVVLLFFWVKTQRVKFTSH
jgi:VanZ family protein